MSKGKLFFEFGRFEATYDASRRDTLKKHTFGPTRDFREKKSDQKKQKSQVKKRSTPRIDLAEKKSQVKKLAPPKMRSENFFDPVFLVAQNSSGKIQA